MSHVLHLLALMILVGCVTQAAAPPRSAVHLLTPNSQFTKIKVESNTLQTGQAQNLYIKLESAPGELVILTLSLTYPSGLKRTLVGSTLTGEVTLSWNIPPKAGVGTATYQLATGGCGCGYGHDGKPKVAIQSIAEGSFTIK
jgi:hypothetical protein